jgi:hypothetical protein
MYLSTKLELRAAAVNPSRARMSTSIGSLRSSQSFAVIPTWLDLRDSHVAEIRMFERVLRESKTHFSPIKQTPDVNGLIDPITSISIPGNIRHLRHYISHKHRDRHWARLHALLTRKNHVFGPAESPAASVMHQMQFSC